MTQTQEQYDELRQKIDALKGQFQKVGQKLFSEQAEQIFIDVPTLEAFRWQQYTPYFNDGSPCEFSVNENVSLKFSDIESPDNDYDEPFIDMWDNPLEDNHPQEEFVKKVSQRLEKFIAGFDEEIMMELFGDHVEVTVRRDGTTEVDEYEHE